LAKEFREFDRIWSTDKFLELPARALSAVLESDSLVLQSENTILSGILAWVNHCLDNKTTSDGETISSRKEELKDLVRYIRFGHMDPSFLVDVVQWIEPIASHPDFITIYKKVQVYKSQKMEIKSNEPFMIPRVYIDKGSSKFNWSFRQITRMQDASGTVESDRFYWHGYYLYLSVQKSGQ